MGLQVTCTDRYEHHIWKFKSLYYYIYKPAVHTRYNVTKDIEINDKTETYKTEE
jgi:hypothetical protein